MEQFAKTIGVLCIFIMVTGILTDIGSFPVTEKTVRFISALYIIVAVVRAFSDTKINIDIKENNFIYEQNTEYLKKEIIEETEIEIKKLIENRLEEKNIAYNLLSVHILEQNGSLTVDEIIIGCSNEVSQLVYSCIEDIISQETKILIGEE